METVQVHAYFRMRYIPMKGLPVGVYSGLVRATDVFGSTAQSAIQYQVVADRVSDDMVMSVPLEVNPSDVCVSASSLSLCYQVHGRVDTFYNLLTDECVSVNAHVSRPFSDADAHIIDKIAIRAIGNNGTCSDILIERQGCSVIMNNKSIPINTHFEEDGITVFHNKQFVRSPPVIHVSVPNCGKPTVDYLFISCTEYHIQGTPTPAEILQFGSSREKSFIQPPHGLIGQFWGSHLVVQPQTVTPPCTPPLPPLPTSRPRKHYDVSVFLRNLHSDQQFSAMLVERNWGLQKTPCLYAGDRQGNPVIQGEFTDYEVEDMFSVQYRFSKFDEDKCPLSSLGWHG